MAPVNIIFVLKRSQQSWGQVPTYGYHSSGLLNSARFVSDMLCEAGFNSTLQEVVDGNEIDRVVTEANADVVILEAIWCPPSKLRELVGMRSHKCRKWIVRSHSQLPFLALEGFSLGWFLEYTSIPGVNISCNSHVATEDLNWIQASRAPSYTPVIFLPNYYPLPGGLPVRSTTLHGELNVGCFGAVRPLKNHIQQAVASIELAAILGISKLRFHINSSRRECQGDPVVKSLRDLFAGHPVAELVEHGWLERRAFLQLCYRMDICTQVSFSETCNLALLDAVSQGVPVVGSPEIPWLPKELQASPTSIPDIVSKMRHALNLSKLGHRNAEIWAREYANRSKRTWLQFLPHQL